VKRFTRAQSIAKEFLVSLHTNACIGECENLSKGVKKNPTLDIHSGFQNLDNRHEIKQLSVATPLLPNQTTPNKIYKYENK
jgi:hypothetical protein